ncbi:MAG: Gfo/Idh/MocA family oxidoreductase [Acidimicrobiales bacterium]
MGDRRCNVGLIGCGMIGQIHADGLSKLVDEGEITAAVACDPATEQMDAVDRNCAFARYTTDPTDLISDPGVDAVVITTPTATHRDLVLATVAAKKPLLCEKPLAPSFSVVEEICDAVRDSKLNAQVGFHSRFHPLVNRMRTLIHSSELGKPMAYTLRDDQYWPTGQVVPGHSSWRSDRAQAGGGALLEHSIHAIDILCWLFGPVEPVHASVRHVFGFEVEDAATLMIEHRSGVIGTLVTIFNGVRGREERRFEVFCESGALELTTDFIVGAGEDSFLVQRPDQPAERPDLATVREEYFDSLGISRRDFLFYTYVADRAWVKSLDSGHKASPDFEDARLAHSVVDAAYRSAESRQPVTL